MPRLVRSAVAVAAVLLATAPAAGAKEITGMKICGQGGCAALERGVGQRFHNTGALERTVPRPRSGERCPTTAWSCCSGTATAAWPAA